MLHQYSYDKILPASRRANWTIEDIIGGDKTLDFSRSFMPDSLARVGALGFLTPEEQRILNQIRGHEYLSIFGLVEEFILPFVVDHSRTETNGDDYKLRALLQFAGEEAKHIHLFKKFQRHFADGFGVACEVIGPARDVAAEVLRHDPLAVALITLHIEWMTQRHYLESVRDDADLDPQFKSLLKHHWMEEAQHAKLDVLMVEALVEQYAPERIDRAVDEYLEIGMFLDAGLKGQTDMNLAAFEKATGRELDGTERVAFLEGQHQSARWTYIGTGMTHPNFIDTVRQISPAGAAKIAEVAPAFC